MKPIELVERAISNSGCKGDRALDPLAGSGTTVLAADRTGRRAHVVEIDQYADVIVRRWQEYSGKTARLNSSGETFAEVSEQRHSAPAQKAA